MKEEQGLVLSVTGDTAKIKVGRHEDCSGCGGCPSAQNVIIEALNEVGAQPGARVSFTMRETNALLGAFVVFMLPLIMAGVGGFVGYDTTFFGGGDTGMIRGAMLFFIISLVLVKLFDRHLRNAQQMKPVITQIIMR